MLYKGQFRAPDSTQLNSTEKLTENRSAFLPVAKFWTFSQNWLSWVGRYCRLL